jgi:hypothetical protein
MTEAADLFRGRGRVATLRKKVWRILRSAPASVRHPKGMTCLDCGFLAFADWEVSTANRVLLFARGQAGCPPLNELRCTKQLWVDYDLTYFGGSTEGLFDELQRRRRPCVGFLRYRPGRSPREHLDLEEKKQARQERLLDTLTGSSMFSSVLSWVPLWHCSLHGC